MQRSYAIWDAATGEILESGSTNPAIQWEKAKNLQPGQRMFVSAFLAPDGVRQCFDPETGKIKNKPRKVRQARKGPSVKALALAAEIDAAETLDDIKGILKRQLAGLDLP